MPYKEAQKAKFTLEDTMMSPKKKQRYNSTLSLTSALDGGWVVNAPPRPLYRRKENR